MKIKEISGSFVCEAPQDSQLDMNEVYRIVDYTKNTWQTNRTQQEAIKDTIQGKKAELVFEHIINKISKIRFISYDSFRKDEYKKHAPFDGLLVRNEVSEDILSNTIKKINDTVKNGSENGRITTDLRKKMEEDKVFTVEIKSSSLKKRDYEGIERKEPRRMEDYKRIVENIKRWDYFMYPHFVRKSDYIVDFFDYCKYVKNINNGEFSELGNEKFLKRLMQIEFENASDIYTRLYFDYITNEIYIPGYILKGDFFKKPVIKKMPGEKSGKALYYMHSISQGRSFIELDGDNRLWQFNRVQAYYELLAGHTNNCIVCQSSLRICRGEQYKNYYYRCYNCNKNYKI